MSDEVFYVPESLRDEAALLHKERDEKGRTPEWDAKVNDFRERCKKEALKKHKTGHMLKV